MLFACLTIDSYTLSKTSASETRSLRDVVFGLQVQERPHLVLTKLYILLQE